MGEDVALMSSKWWSGIIDPMRIQEESIARASFIILLANFLSRILGFVREILIAQFFGAQAVTDSFLVAQVLPATIAGLIGGALTTVFIPVFVEEREKHGEEKAWEGARAVFGVSFLYLLFMLGVGYGIAPFFIRGIAPGFEGERLHLAVRMNQVMLPSLLSLGLLGLMTGVFQAYRFFTLPAIAGLLSNVCLIAFLLGAKRHPVASLGGGSLAGAVVQVLFLVVLAKRKWPFWGVKLSFSHPMLKRMWKLMIPIFIGTGVGYLNLIVDRIFASLLPTGTIAALNFAIRVKEIPTGLFGAALSQAIYPVTALQVSRGKTEELRDLFSRSLETLWLFTVPSVAGLILLSQETIRFFFERGAFTASATVITSQALLFYSLGLVPAVSLDIVGKIFYSFQDTQTPVKVGILGLLLNIVLNIIFIKPMAHRGLALATSLSATFMFLVLLEILRRRLKGIGGKALLANLGKIFLATFTMTVVLLFARPFARTWWGYLGTVGLGASAYGGFTLLFRPRSSERILEALKGKRFLRFSKRV